MENVITLSNFFGGEFQSRLERYDYIYVVSVFRSSGRKKPQRVV